jgi:hypothetical protein
VLGAPVAEVPADDAFGAVVPGDAELVGGGVELVCGGPGLWFGRPGGEPPLPTPEPVPGSDGVDADDVPGVVGSPLLVGGGIGDVQIRVGCGDLDPGVGEVAVVVDGEGVGTVAVSDGELVAEQCRLILPLCPNKWWCSAADTAGRREEPAGIWSSQCLLFSLAPAP